MDKIITTIIFALGLLIGMLVGVDHGWKSRINYEAEQCLDHGRCFH